MSRKYITIWINGESWLEHRWVWTQAHGPIPDGYVIHHINHDSRDNRLENLELMEQNEHKRHHANYSINDQGVLVKICTTCGETKPVDTGFYINRNSAIGGVIPQCIECDNKRCRENYRKRMAVA